MKNDNPAAGDAMPEKTMQQRLSLVPAPRPGRTGIAAGTVVMTADGALPVDFVEPGDWVIARSGLRMVRAVRQHRYSGPAIRIGEGALGEGRPEQVLILPAAAPVLICDARASFFGRKCAVIPVADLVDGDGIAPAGDVTMRLYDLRFDAPEIVHAEGLQIACLAVEDAGRLAAE
jgi:hypothetical protein